MRSNTNMMSDDELRQKMSDLMDKAMKEGKVRIPVFMGKFMKGLRKRMADLAIESYKTGYEDGRAETRGP